jgi:hypothetical protein
VMDLHGMLLQRQVGWIGAPNGRIAFRVGRGPPADACPAAPTAAAACRRPARS